MNNISVINEDDNFENLLKNIDLLIQSGNFDEALKTCIKLEVDFSHAPSLNFKIALIYKNLGNLNLAIKYYTKVLDNKPDEPNALNNLGNILNHNNQPEQASTLFFKVILLMPNAPQPYANLSHSYNLMEKFDDAINYGLKALELNPKFIQAYEYVSNAQYSLGLYNEAISTITKAINIDDNNSTLLKTFISLLPKIKSSEYNSSLDEVIGKVLKKNLISSDTISDLLSRIESHPDIDYLICHLNNDNYFSNDLPNIIKKLKTVPHFFKIISEDIVKNKKIEFILTKIRKEILHNLEKYKNDEMILEFQTFITFQCFNNEFVYFQTIEEAKLIKDIENQLKIQAENNQFLSSLHLLSLGSYINIGHFDWSRAIRYDKKIKDIFKEIISNVLLENSIKNRIPSLKPITDETSKLVEKQYTENPYPRWIRKTNTSKININELIQREKINVLKTPDNPISPNIMIAGSGTGQQLMKVAGNFPSSDILAVDLSADSLAYALRKLKELNFNNITYLKGDILDISVINKKFDIIECTGVLHHMEEPIKGLESLIGNLKENGLLKIALYSKLARHEIIKFRKLIDRKKDYFSENFVRNLRNDIFTRKNSDYDEFIKIPQLNDFFSMSGIRDLLFHSKEHQFTILDIKKILDDYGLHFGGFVFGNTSHLNNFKKMFPNQNSEYSLDNWNEFELNFGTNFIGMYQFWVQKK